MSLLKEISITDLSNLRIGHASDYNAQTGVTVLYFPLGAKVGCDISGGGPASRETPLTSPVTADNPSMLLSCPEVLPMDWLLLTV